MTAPAFAPDSGLVVTVTPSPSLDLTYLLPPGTGLDGDVEVHRAQAVTIEPSGKGVNVTRTLALAGRRGVAVLPCGGATGRHLVELLDRFGIENRVVPAAGDTRVNTTVISSGRPTVKLNSPGAALTDDEIAALVAALDSVLADHPEASGQVWLAVCGSLPAGTPEDAVRRLVDAAHARHVRCAVDTSGAWLRSAVDAGADLVAPNLGELAALGGGALGRGFASGEPDELANACATFSADHGTQLLVSLGAGGALWTDGRSALHGRGEAVVPLNAAGAGDALLAGWLAGGTDPVHRLRTAVSWGRAACLSRTTVADAASLTSPGEGPPVQVRQVPLRQPDSATAGGAAATART